MKKLFLIAGFALATMAGVAFADGTSASSESDSGSSTSMLGGAGSIGNGAAASISGVQSTQQTSGAAVAVQGEVGLGPFFSAGGSAAGSTTQSSDNTVRGSASISTGQAGAFSGVAGTSGSGSYAKAKARQRNR